MENNEFKEVDFKNFAFYYFNFGNILIEEKS